MRLKQPFLKLHKSFDPDRLAAEVRALSAAAWLPHPGNYPGNDAVLLVTPGGQMTNGFTGQMAATDHLRACAYIMEVMGEIGAVWGRSRLMGLGAGASVPPHVDVNYHWRTHMRIHIPVITNPRVLFTCGDESVHMEAGSCWLFDSFRMHNVHNGGSEKRVHLVLDTVDGEEMWDLIDEAQNGAPSPAPRTSRPLRFEKVDMNKIMSPWEVRCHIAFLAEYAVPDPRLDGALNRLERFAAAWTSAWCEYESDPAGLPDYRRLIAGLRQDLMASGGGGLPLRNQVPLIRALTELIFDVAAPNPAPVATVALAS
ncbi:aspartyl/asparaginyl beta-hydroxylase domain-containing protein [Sphingomonas sp. R647]|uniref:aspartyl/asparaginyl beta-hydroxylase domain-containing protein n=1 Tax=Sphingomonas sp. R647 TaxID=2875233 RepID=UPI001CD4C304|nr:aspartyl/asparaginyl beta-hydroxylase domain-containing protein [Sphingomonas sp. R647]MCA1200256.1 aspartyl/asparaginyl beta-hydroxylase domain-containing protein [Sphingomonas sp. R647]